MTPGRRARHPFSQWVDKVKTSFETDFVGALRRGSDAMDTFFAGIRDKVTGGSFQRDFLDVFAALHGEDRRRPAWRIWTRYG